MQNTGGAGSDQLRQYRECDRHRLSTTRSPATSSPTSSPAATATTCWSAALGNDTLSGGFGIDTASYAAATGAVRVNLDASRRRQSTISAGSDTLSGFENLTGGAYDDQLTGDNGNNILTGNAGNDLLVGGLGDDTLSGGAGIDTASYANATAGVTISLLLTSAAEYRRRGIDTSRPRSRTSPARPIDDVLTGSAQVNVITGGNGNDTIDAGSSNDTVDGGYGNDIIKGAAGDDILIGRVGSDTHHRRRRARTPSPAAPRPTSSSMPRSATAPATADRITDFASGDILDVSAIDADTMAGATRQFHFVGAFTHSGGEYQASRSTLAPTPPPRCSTPIATQRRDMTILFDWQRHRTDGHLVLMIWPR